MQIDDLGVVVEACSLLVRPSLSVSVAVSVCVFVGLGREG